MLDRKKALIRRITNLRRKLNWAHSQACMESWHRQKPLDPARLRQAVVETETEVGRLGLEEFRPAVAELWSLYDGIERVLKEDEDEWMFDDYESLGGYSTPGTQDPYIPGAHRHATPASPSGGDQGTDRPAALPALRWDMTFLIEPAMAYAEARFAADGAWPSVADIMEATGCDDRKAIAALNWLKGGKLPP